MAIRTKSERKWRLLSAFLFIIVLLFVVGKYPLVINWIVLIFLTLVVIAYFISQALQIKLEISRDLEIKKTIQKRIYESDENWIDRTNCQKHSLDFTGNLALYDFWVSGYCILWLAEKNKMLGGYRMPLKLVLDVLQKSKLIDALTASQVAGIPILKEKLREEGITVT